MVPALAATDVRILINGPLELDVDRLRLRVDGRPISLGGLQLKLLLHLARHPDRVFTREQLLAELHGDDANDRDPKGIDVVVCRLRRKLGAAGGLVESVKSFGYRMKASQE